MVSFKDEENVCACLTERVILVNVVIINHDNAKGVYQRMSAFTLHDFESDEHARTTQRPCCPHVLIYTFFVIPFFIFMCWPNHYDIVESFLKYSYFPTWGYSSCKLSQKWTKWFSRPNYCRALFSSVSKSTLVCRRSRILKYFQACRSLERSLSSHLTVQLIYILFICQ